MIQLIVLLMILGVVLYLIETYVPMDPAIKTVIRVLVVLVLVIFLLRVFGIADTPLLRVR